MCKFQKDKEIEKEHVTVKNNENVALIQCEKDRVIK